MRAYDTQQSLNAHTPPPRLSGTSPVAPAAFSGGQTGEGRAAAAHGGGGTGHRSFEPHNAPVQGVPQLGSGSKRGPGSEKPRWSEAASNHIHLARHGLDRGRTHASEADGMDKLTRGEPPGPPEKSGAGRMEERERNRKFLKEALEACTSDRSLAIETSSLAGDRLGKESKLHRLTRRVNRDTVKMAVEEWLEASQLSRAERLRESEVNFFNLLPSIQTPPHPSPSAPTHWDATLLAFEVFSLTRPPPSDDCRR